MRVIQNLAFLILFSLNGFAQEIVNIKIKENKVSCTGVVPMECLLVKEGKSKEWTYFYDVIQGFNYEPGFIYKLKVEKNKKKGNLPADASAYTYKLKKIVAKKKVKNTNYTQESISNIYGKKLVLIQLNDKPVTNGSVYFEMNKINKSISGKSGINRFNSSFEFKNKELIILPGIGTLMSGDPKAMELENEFLKTMSIPFKVEQSGNTVKFLNAKNNKVAMVFNIPTSADIWFFIKDKEWKLLALDNIVKDYGKAFIRFDVSDNSISGNNGCNRFFGSYSAKDDKIVFEGIGSTRMACANAEANRIEQKMMQYLNDGTLRFDVADQTLNFYKDNRLVMIFGL